MEKRGRTRSNLSSRKARAALQSLLLNCRREKLDEFTAEGLAGSYNVKVADAERMLLQARRGRLV